MRREQIANSINLLFRILMILGLLGIPSAGQASVQIVEAMPSKQISITKDELAASAGKRGELQETNGQLTSLVYSEWSKYIDPDFGWAIRYPSEWSNVVSFENLNNPSEKVIKRRVALYGPDRATIWIDTYENLSALSLDVWFRLRKQPLLSSPFGKTILTYGYLNGVQAIMAIDDTDSTVAPQVVVVALYGKVAIAVTYLVLDGAAARVTFQDIVRSFVWAASTSSEVSSSANTQFSDLTAHLLPSRVVAAQCCGINSPGNICLCCTRDKDGAEVGNCVWWACHTRSDVGCAGNANTWDECAEASGKTVNTTPAVGALAVWNTGNHIALVEQVNQNQSQIYVSEMDCYSSRACGSNIGYNGVNHRWVDSSDKKYIQSGNTTPSPTPITCPDSGGVLLYKDVGYNCGGEGEGSGWMRRDNTGWQNTGSFNDRASSIRVPSGWSVKLFENGDRSGGSTCRTSNDDSFVGDRFSNGVGLNDSISSFEVFQDSRCGEPEPPCPSPNSVSPASGQTFEGRTVTFDWDDVSCNHNGFTFRVRTGLDMDRDGEVVIDVGEGGTGRTVAFDSQWDNRDLYWSVKAANAPGGASWAPSRRFRISPNRPPSIAFNTANGNSANEIASREQNWTFQGTASDPEGQLRELKFHCHGDACNEDPTIALNGNWSHPRNGLTGRNEVWFTACDNLQCSDSRHVVLKIDLAAPTTVTDANGQSNPTGWFRVPVNVTMRAQDGATGNAAVGVRELRYRVDGGVWQTQSGSEKVITIANDGNHIVEYYAIDHLDNQENTKTIAFKIDITPPNPPGNASESNGVISGHWQRTYNTPNFTWPAASDATSGVQFYNLELRNEQGVVLEGGLSRTANDRQYTRAGLPTGTYLLRGQTQDYAGNTSAWVTMFTYRYDGTAPENPETATHVAGISSNTWQSVTNQANFNWPTPHDEGSGIKGYHIYWGDQENGENTEFRTTPSFQAAPLCATNAVCTGYLRLRSVDNVDNGAEQWSTVFTLRYDKVPPTVDITFNGGVTQTAQTQIVLNINANDQGSGVKAMRFSADGVNWTTWEAYAATRSWLLPPISREFWPIYAQVRDGVGLVSTVVTKKIYFDVNTRQPRSANFRLFDHTLSAGAGVHTSSAYRARSTVGQVVDSARTSSTHFQLNGGYEAGSQAIPLVDPGHDEFNFINGIFASGVVANTMQSASFQMIGTLGEPGLPNNVTTLTSSSFRHQPGFLAAAPIAQTTPAPLPTQTPGPTPPPDPVPVCEFPQVSINDNATFTYNPNVTLNLCAPRAVEMRVSNDDSFTSTQWEPYARSKVWTLLTAGQLVVPRVVYVSFKDADGSIHGAYFDDILLDPNPPSGSISVGDAIPANLLAQQIANSSAVVASPISFGVQTRVFLPFVQSLGTSVVLLSSPLIVHAAGVSDDTTVDLTLTAQDDNSGLAEMQVSDSPDFNTANWEPYSVLKPWAIIGDDGTKTLYVRFRDHSGNISNVFNTSYLLDSHPPLGGIDITEDIVGINTVAVQLNFYTEDNLTGAVAMRVAEDPFFTNAPWQALTTSLNWPIQLGPEDWEKIIYVQFRDLAGNVSQTYSDAFLVDREPPIVSVEVDVAEELTHTTHIYAYDGLSALHTLRLTNDPLFIEGIVTLPYTDTVQWTFDERRVVWVQAQDSVGNISAPYPAYAASVLSTPTPTPTATPTPTLTPTSTGQPTPTPTATPPIGNAQLPLVTGWNLVALPRVPASGAPNALFAPIVGSYDLVYAYDGCVTNNPWRKYNPSGPPFANTLTTISVTQGLWVRATSPVTLTVTGAAPANTSIPLCAGWNLITYPGNSATPIATALAGIAGQYNLVYTYEASTPANPWKKYNPSGPPFANTLSELKPGKGYWIRVTQATTLLVP